MKYMTKSNLSKLFAISLLLTLCIDVYSCRCTSKYCSEKEQKQVTSKTISTDKITAEIPIGELVDKITILQIKTENIKDTAKLANIQTELTTLIETRNNQILKNIDQKTLNTLNKLTAQLLEINKKLWVIEDNIRDKERSKCFDKEFIELARSVYVTNDDRCRVKRAINELLGSRLTEEKSYAAY